MKRRKIILTNDFHHTCASTWLTPDTGGHYRIRKAEMDRVWHTLCGIHACVCGDTFGARGGDTRLELIHAYESFDDRAGRRRTRGYVVDVVVAE